jgi:hypothetical protein
MYIVLVVQYVYCISIHVFPTMHGRFGGWSQTGSRLHYLAAQIQLSYLRPPVTYGTRAVHYIWFRHIQQSTIEPLVLGIRG